MQFFNKVASVFFFLISWVVDSQRKSHKKFSRLRKQFFKFAFKEFLQKRLQECLKKASKFFPGVSLRAFRAVSPRISDGALTLELFQMFQKGRSLQVLEVILKILLEFIRDFSRGPSRTFFWDILNKNIENSSRYSSNIFSWNTFAFPLIP